MVIESWVLVSSMALVTVSEPMLSKQACLDHVKNMTYKFNNNICLRVQHQKEVDTTVIRKN